LGSRARELANGLEPAPVDKVHRRPTVQNPQRLIVKDEQEVYDELDYLRIKSKLRKIDLVDTNFGIMGKRDLRIARHILKMYQKTGFPYVMGWATAKNKSDISVEIMRTMAGITGKLYLGLQTLTESALNACNRKNLPAEVLDKLIELSRKENIPIHVDLIFGLPTETKESFLETLGKLAEMGIEGPLVYQLRMLPGTELSENREKYGYKTRRRVCNNRWGDYPFGEVVETEEIAVESNSFSFEDYLLIRRIGFLTTLLLEYAAFGETLKAVAKMGANLIDLLERIASDEKMFKEYDAHAIGELRGNPGWCKINLGFTGCSLFTDAYLSGIEAYIREFINEYIESQIKEDKLLLVSNFSSPYEIPEEEKLKQTIKDCEGLEGYYQYERIVTNAPRISMRRRKNE